MGLRQGWAPLCVERASLVRGHRARSVSVHALRRNETIIAESSARFIASVARSRSSPAAPNDAPGLVTSRRLDAAAVVEPRSLAG